MTASATASEVLPGQLDFAAPRTVREALASMGRTEDVRISPDGSRLVFACYARAQIAVAEVSIERDPSRVAVAIPELTLHEAPWLQEPHGIDFVGNDVLLVADRRAGLQLLRLPSAGSGDAPRRVGSLAPAFGACGSVVVRPGAAGGHDAWVAHNWSDVVARYRIAGDGSIASGDVAVRHGLDLPDGLAVSDDGRWLAVSNHETHDVLVFETDASADPAPVGVLRGVSYPHGLRFAYDDRVLLVADAGAPYVSVFTRAGDAWMGATYPSSWIRVLDRDTFARGHHDPREGGPKGLDVERRTNVLVVTTEQLPVAFFDLEVALTCGADGAAERLVTYELGRLRDLERLRAEADDARAALSAVLETKAWRMTRPARWAYGVARKARR
jgi:hypothetical protein